MYHCKMSRTLAALTGALALFGGAGAGTIPLPEFSVTLDFNALSINRVGQIAPELCLFPGIAVSGFSDELHPDNLGRVTSLNGAHAGQTGKGSSSAAFETVAELRDSADDPEGWLVEIVDGATGGLYSYSFSLDVSALVSDHLRRTTIGVLSPGDTIPLNPTFHFIVDQPEDPKDPTVQYELAVAVLLGPQSYFLPSLSVVDTQWTPEGPIQPGTYRFIVQFQGNADPNTLLVPTTPQPVSSEPPLAGFSYSGTFGSYCDIFPLQAAPPACPGDLNGDNAVNTTDLTLLLSQFGAAVTPGTGGDLNNDGVVNTSDLTFFLSRFGRPCV